MGPLFDRLVDDAALFPPERAPMDDALAAYRAALAQPDTILGRFLCPASRVAELRAHLIPEDLLDLGIIADAEELPKAVEAAASEPRVRPASVEIALPEEADQARAVAVTIAGLPYEEIPTYFEVRRTPGWRDVLDRLAAAREHGAPLAAKLRTGGMVPEAFPSTAELAAFIAACAERDLPFKCTAGLHHAVRNASTGHHGFLNILVATSQAPSGALQEILEEHDPAPLTRAARGADAAFTRHLMTSFGSCDIAVPQTDLGRLGLIGHGNIERHDLG
ncbi:hypothetical protein J4573_47575 [Actinomadura barringtoniae]|uniref:Uncharacterized protein n=1 Tax=Actinomadura barringtoniae TaxID=1427535 RepID=A0A939PM38_9ACTN|nr:hypothetical protein [Actinomadura barringtoniae]MBO2454820.1 hypothetical protein [Actinomadura barringtoniae]